MELGTNWELVDRAIFAELRHANADTIAAAYAAEAMSDNPNDTRLITLHEMGQRLFSHANNGRTARESLFMQRVISEAAKVAANA
jgi:hypothetical protein